MHKLSISAIFWFAVFAGLVIYAIPNFPTLKALAYSSPCEFPLTYRIDEVDPRFKLTKEQFLDDIKKSEAVWEKAAGYNLFDYQSNGQLSLNLVFDERQSLTDQIDSLENNLDQGQKDLQAQQKQYTSLETSFQQHLTSFNKEVAYYNSQGGAPAAEYDRLIAEQAELKKEGDRLTELGKKLNKDVAAYNQQVGKLNKTVDNFTAALSQRPEEGIYLGEKKRIEIYFVVSKGELLHTLTHELGHSLGMPHHDDPAGIMYPYTTESVQLTQADIDSITAVCRKLTFFDRLGRNLSYLVQTYFPQKN